MVHGPAPFSGPFFSPSQNPWESHARSKKPTDVSTGDFSEGSEQRARSRRVPDRQMFILSTPSFLGAFEMIHSVQSRGVSRDLPLYLSNLPRLPDAKHQRGTNNRRAIRLTNKAVLAMMIQRYKLRTNEPIASALESVTA